MIVVVNTIATTVVVANNVFGSNYLRRHLSDYMSSREIYLRRRRVFCDDILPSQKMLIVVVFFYLYLPMCQQRICRIFEFHRCRCFSAGKWPLQRQAYDKVCPHISSSTATLDTQLCSASILPLQPSTGFLLSLLTLAKTAHFLS